ncbi:UNVERIFIED_CONTAM: hypothetical protein RMT77_003244 [Armadillidium vulgare]
MSNLQNNVETPMMEPRRPKRDAVEKRIRKLKIGIYTSFILSLVAIAISIVLLTKVQKLQEEMLAVQTELSKVPVEQFKKLNTKFQEVEETLESFRDNVINHNVKSILIRNDSTVVKSLPPLHSDPNNSNNNNNNSNVFIFYKEDPFNDKTNSKEDEELKVDGDDSMGLVDSVDSIDSIDNVDTVVEIGDSAEVDKAEDPHAHHHHHGPPVKTGEADLPKTPVKKRMCEDDNNDDSDLCDEEEGSGAGGDQRDNTDDDVLNEGSGSHDHSDCIQFPRPVCPSGHKICYTKNKTNKCPIPICCPDS